MKLNNYQKLVLNTINAGILDIGWLICFLFGINYVKQLAVFISMEYHYWLTIFLGFTLIILTIWFIIISQR